MHPAQPRFARPGRVQNKANPVIHRTYTAIIRTNLFIAKANLVILRTYKVLFRKQNYDKYSHNQEMYSHIWDKKIMFRTIKVIVKAHPALLGIVLPSTIENFILCSFVA